MRQNQIKKVAAYLDVQVLDNMIITRNGYYSFADDWAINEF